MRTDDARQQRVSQVTSTAAGKPHTEQALQQFSGVTTATRQGAHNTYLKLQMTQADDALRLAHGGVPATTYKIRNRYCCPCLGIFWGVGELQKVFSQETDTLL